jgi:predicted dehydrogenase
MADDSWSAELAAFLADIRLNRQPSPNLGDALAALRVVERIYEQGVERVRRST